MSGQLVVLNGIPDFDGNSGTIGSGYRIGDNYILTAGHVFFDWNRQLNPTINDIVFGPGTQFLDYRGYRSAYLSAVINEINLPGPDAVNESIEGHIGSRDSVVVQKSGTLGANDDGLVVFLTPIDLVNATTVLAGSQVIREADVTGLVTTGTVLSAASGQLIYSEFSQYGDSGGAYLLSYAGRDFVIGTHSGNIDANGNGNNDSGDKGAGTYFSYTDWLSINLLLELAQAGNVTGSEPTNLVVGSVQDDAIAGSFRPDLLMGRDGNDVISDGDDILDFVWADDTLVGGAGDDQFTAGAGDDTIWGGDNNSETGHSDGIDTVSYANALTDITVTISGATIPIVTVLDGSGQSGTDTLHSIERIIGSENADTLVLQTLTNQIGSAFDYIDLGGSEQDTVDLSALTGSVTVDLRQTQSQTITFGSAVLNIRNAERVIGTGQDDTIYGPSNGTPTTITAGAGNDTIHLAGADHTVLGGDGEDTIVLTAVTGARVDGIGHSVTIGGGASGYSDVETIQGSSGNDRMFGGDTGHYIAGSGTSYLEGSGSDAILESTTGDTYFAVSNGATVISGAGNDYIEVSGTDPVIIKFGAGSGHDMLGSYFRYGDNWAQPRNNDLIILEGLLPSDIELVWNFTETHNVGNNDANIWIRDGEAAIRIISTGETLYLGNIRYIAYLQPNDSSWYLQLGGPNNFSLFTYDYERMDYQTSWGEPAPSNDLDPYINTHELDIFSFDGINKLNLFELFDLDNVVASALPPETKAAQDLLSRIANGNGSGLAVGTSGNDSLNGSSANEDLLAGDGDDLLDGEGGNDYLRGGDGDDTITGRAGNDNIGGGGGRDGINYSLVGAGVTVSLALTTAQNTGGAGTDTIRDIEDLTGSVFNDVLAGNAQRNTIDGGTGNDTIDGGSEDDILVGGAGTDTLSYMTSNAGVSVDLSLAGEQDTTGAGYDTISGFENLTGSAYADSLTGDANANKITGGSGDDSLYGSGGTDTLDGGAGNDVIDGGADRDIVTYASATAGVVVNLSLSGPQNTGGGGIDTLIGIENIVGSNFDDTLIGSAEGNNIKGGAGNDSISGSGLNDVLEGGEGNDILNGDAGFDVVSYSTATAGVTVSLAISTAQDTGAAGVDTLTGLERLTGSAYSDVLGGSSDANIIVGGAGNDRITGGYGNDTLTGEAGADTFIFDAALSASGNTDKITDFVSTLDIIELNHSIFLAFGGPGVLLSSQFQVGTAANDAQDRIIYDQSTGNIYYDADGNGAGAQILFAQVTAGQTLAFSDFIIV